MNWISTLAGLALAAGLLAPAQAAAQPRTFRYAVTHSRYGPIGAYVHTIDEAGGVTRAQSHLDVVVKILGIVVHRESADQTEVWRGGRLASLDSTTLVNGQPQVVHGVAAQNRFLVTTATGTAAAPADVTPSDPWAFSRMGPGVVVSLKSGRIDQVVVSGGEPEAVLVQGRSTPTRHFHVSTTVQPNKWEVWLDAQGVPVKFRSFERGDSVDFTLAAPVLKSALAGG
jgi:hypothetical protein